MGPNRRELRVKFRISSLPRQPYAALTLHSTETKPSSLVRPCYEARETDYVSEEQVSEGQNDSFAPGLEDETRWTVGRVIGA